MAITEFQRGICRLIAQSRIRQGDGYVAGGVALNTLLGASRISRDIDLFHDTREALAVTWDADPKQLREHGYEIEVRRERPTFVEAVVRRAEESVVLEWVCDSACHPVAGGRRDRRLFASGSGGPMRAVPTRRAIPGHG